MEKKELIKSSYFFDMFDCLLRQFFKKKKAYCVGRDFGEDIIPRARDYFSIVIEREKLPKGFSFLSMLNNNVDKISEAGITIIIFVDSTITKAILFQPFFSIILAHEICHFAFFYERYIKFVDNNNNIKHDDFIEIVSNILPFQQKNDNTYPIIGDKIGYNIVDLIKKFGKYPKEHFTNGKDSDINYEELFNDLINHLNFLAN
jgi:hypothetical protein